MLQRRLQKGLISILWIFIQNAGAEILTPPYFNLAEGKEITASATCGVDTPGPELYCKLVGANADQAEDINLIQGQVGSIIIILFNFYDISLFYSWMPPRIFKPKVGAVNCDRLNGPVFFYRINIYNW